MPHCAFIALQKGRPAIRVSEDEAVHKPEGGKNIKILWKKPGYFISSALCGEHQSRIFSVNYSADGFGSGRHYEARIDV